MSFDSWILNCKRCAVNCRCLSSFLGSTNGQDREILICLFISHLMDNLWKIISKVSGTECEIGLGHCALGCWVILKTVLKLVKILSRKSNSIERLYSWERQNTWIYFKQWKFRLKEGVKCSKNVIWNWILWILDEIQDHEKKFETSLEVRRWTPPPPFKRVLKIALIV